MATFNEDAKGIRHQATNATIHFPFLEKPDDGKYGVFYRATFCFPKDDEVAVEEVKKLNKVITRALRDGFPDATDAELKTMSRPIFDGDKYVSSCEDAGKEANATFRDAVAGCYYLITKAKDGRKPKTFGSPKVGGKYPPIPATDIEPTDKVVVDVGITAWPNNNGGASAWLNGVLLREKGEGSGGGFDHLEDETYAAETFDPDDLPM